MFSILRWMKGEHNAEIMRVAKKQLAQNREVLESLRDYDAGKKDIPTTDVERRLQHLQTAP